VLAAGLHLLTKNWQLPACLNTPNTDTLFFLILEKGRKKAPSVMLPGVLKPAGRQVGLQNLFKYSF
jgi:hypothetical protein